MWAGYGTCARMLLLHANFKNVHNSPIFTVLSVLGPRKSVLKPRLAWGRYARTRVGALVQEFFELKGFTLLFWGKKGPKSGC